MGRSNREKSKIAIAIFKKMTLSIAPKLFGILGAPIIFWSTVYPNMEASGKFVPCSQDLDSVHYLTTAPNILIMLVTRRNQIYLYDCNYDPR